MSRSKRHTPICGNTLAESEKKDKVMAHRAERRAANQALSADEECPDPKEFGNPWSAAKDGRHYFGSKYPKLLRK